MDMPVREHALRPADTRRGDVPDRDLQGHGDDTQILQALCHGFGSASELSQASHSALRWVQTVVGLPSSARIALLDRSGRLRSAASSGDLSVVGRRRSARRRLACETKRPSLQELRQPPGGLLGLFPLVSGGEVFGVLEVAAPGRVIEHRWQLLEAVASQTAMTVRNLRRVATLERRVEALEAAADLVHGLLGARNVHGAVRSMVRLCYELVQTPIAAWVADPDGPSLTFQGARGLGARKRAEVRSAFPTLPGHDDSSRADREELEERFAGIVGAARATVIDARDAVILVADDPRAENGFLPALSSLFRDALSRLGATAAEQRREESLDLGLAWTAHEVRTPLLGARATIESLLEVPEPQVTSRELLSRSQEELSELAGTVDTLLRWAAGREPLHRTRTDLVRVIGEAIQHSARGAVRDRVNVSTPRELFLRADPTQLRSAVANLVRNALDYSPPESEVRISVEHEGDTVTVVVRDEGSGVLPGERDSIFNPLVRGASGRSVGGGQGLGLFIARRAVQAHGGTIRVDPTDDGTAFRIQLPLEPCAS
jgi:signal transduction histidine kinase